MNFKKPQFQGLYYNYRRHGCTGESIRSTYDVVQYLDHDNSQTFTRCGTETDLTLSTFFGTRFFRRHYISAFRRHFTRDDFSLLSQDQYAHHLQLLDTDWLDTMLGTTRCGYLDIQHFLRDNNQNYTVFICPSEVGGLDVLFVTEQNNTIENNIKRLDQIKAYAMPGVSSEAKLGWAVVICISLSFLTRASMYIPSSPTVPQLFTNAVRDLSRELHAEFHYATQYYAVDKDRGCFALNPYAHMYDPHCVVTPIVTPVPTEHTVNEISKPVKEPDLSSLSGIEI